MIAHFYQSRRNVVVMRANPERGFGERARIDVWWSGLEGNGGLMKILAYLLQTSIKWQNAEVRLKVVAPDAEAARARQDELLPVIEQLRTGALLDVITAEGRSFDDLLQASSRGADLVFLGMARPGEPESYVDYYEGLLHRTEDLPTTAFVLAAEEISFRDVLT
jgi:hypothetical protein